MNKVELEAINSIVNSSLKTIEEKSGMERIREMGKSKSDDEAKGKIRNDADRKKDNIQRDRELKQSSIQTSEAKGTISGLMEFLKEVSTIISEKKHSSTTAKRLEDIVSNAVKAKTCTPNAIDLMKDFTQVYRKAYNIITPNNNKLQDSQNGSERN